MSIIGEAFVAVRPETAGFGAETEGLLSRAVGAIPGPVIFGAIAAAGAAAAFDIGEHFEDAFRKISKATGETGDGLAGLEDSFKRVFAAGPESMGKVADALSLVSQRTHDTGADLDQLTESELKLARVTGGDVKNVVDETTKVFQNWGITGIGPSKLALDELLKVSEDTGISVDSLSSSVVGKAGAVFRQFGVDLGAAASIMGTLQEAGVQTGPVVMGLARTFTTASKEGKDAHQVLADLFDTLKNGQAGTDAYNEAIKTLGQRGFASLADVVKSGKLTIDDFTGTMANAAGQVDRVADANLSLGEKFDILKNKALVALEPISIKLVDLVTILVDDIPLAVAPVVDVFETIGAAVSDFVQGFTVGTDEIGSAQTVWAQWGAVAYEAFSVVEEQGRQALTILRGLWDDVVAGFEGKSPAGPVSFLTQMFYNLGGVYATVLGGLQEAWAKAVELFNRPDVQDALERVRSALAKVGDFARDHLGVVFATLGVVIAAAFGPIVGIPLLVAGLETLWQRSAKFRDIVHDVGAALSAAGSIIASHRQLFVALGVAIALVVAPVPTLIAGLALLYAKFEPFRSLVNTVGAALADFGRFFSDRWEKIAASVRNVFDGIVIGLKVLAVGIGAALLPAIFLWQHFHDQVFAVAELVWGQIENLISTTVRILGDIFDLMISLLSGKWGDAWNDVKDILGAAVDFLKDSFGNLLTFVVDFFSSLPGNMLSALGDIGSRFLGIGGKALSGLTSGLEQAVPALLLWLLGLPKQIYDALKDADHWLKEKGIEILTGLVTGLAEKLIDLEGWWLSLPGAILGAIPGAASWLLQTGINVMNGLWDGIKNTFFNIVDWFGGLPQRLKDGLGDVGSWLVDLGGNIISGLKHGIDAAWGDIIDFVKHKGSDLIHTITHPWEAFSPSRLTMRLGQNIGDGLAGGLADRFGLVEVAAAELSRRAMMTIVPPALGGAPGVNAALGRTPVPSTYSQLGGVDLGDLLRAVALTNQLLREQTDAIRRTRQPSPPPAPYQPSPSELLEAQQAQQAQSVR